MTEGFAARGRAPARLLVLCAALLGLFLMHGAPAGAAGGCEGTVQAAVPGHTPHSAAARTAVPAHRPHPTAMPHARAEKPRETAGETTGGTAAGAAPYEAAPVHAAAASGSHGAQCVSTAARDRVPVPAAATATTGALAGLLARPPTGRRWSGAGGSRRGPPGGRDLLLEVCVART